PHSTNIQAIEQALESNPLVLVGYRQNGWGGHAVLAYGSEKGSWTENGRTYDSRILICDPNASKARNDQFDIYYNSSTYEWTIPRYEKNSGLSSSNGAVFNYVGADISDINAGGYLNGAASSNSPNGSGSYVARIDAHNASSGDLSVTKVEAHDGAYVEMATSAGDIVEDYSYMPSGESEGLYGFDLRDADASYLVEKNTASDDVSLVMHYEDALMNASIDGEGSVVFDRAGSVTVQGEGAYSVSMAHDGETPTDWFAMSVSGQSDGTASVSMTSDGYVIDSEDMQNVTVVGNDKDEEVRLSFSTTKDQALVHEINEDTADEALAVSIDSDGNGSFDKVIATSKGNPGCSFEVFAGAERFSTARIMVDAELELGSYSGVVVVGGQKELNKKGGETKYPDALSAAGLAGALGYPLVMVNGAGLTGQNKQALKAVMDSNGGKKLDILVIGGEYAVSKGVESQLAAYGKVSSRIAGTTRYDTNRAVYQYGKQRGLWNTSAMFVATGQNFPDALAIAPYLAWKGAPIVLTDPDRPQRLAEAAGILADAGEIIALGDVQVVPSSQLEALGMSYAERLSGTNRYQTGAAIVAWELEQGMSLEGAGFATGANFPDALASSFLLGRTGSVLCLVSPKGSQNSALQSALAGHDAPAYVRVFGGEYAVSQSRYSDIAGWLGCAGFNANPRK
ncbi:MAG: cell wall-binding repeat-containing protein, partial [Eggerthellaceae bacterium]|nr:cell wall-binding repeat-containing protein [Eggerthellaceae bacterium]